jgi:hypothetical protein
MFKRAIAHRDEFITAQALIYALDGLQQLPEDQRPESNIDHRKAILAELPIPVREMAERVSDSGRGLLYWPPQLAASSVPSTNPPEEKNERGRNPAE